MARVNAAHLSFAQGEVSTNAIARVDLEKMRLAAELQRNFVPRAIGQMMPRPGFEYLGATKANARAKFFEFVFSSSDYAAFEFTDSVLRVWRGEPLAPITRTSVSTAITNGNFASATGWTQTSAGGGGSSFATNNLTLSAPARGGFSRVSQAVTVSVGDQNKAHGLRIRVSNGKVLFRVGSTSGGQEYISETPLENGYHSLEFTPTGGTFYVQFENREQRALSVYSIAVEAAGVVEIPSPYALADLPSIRKFQTGDLVYLACSGKRPYSIERRSQTSFSLVEFRPVDGPFTKARTAQIRLKPSTVEGNGTLTADFAFFRPEHVGAIFELFHGGYTATFRLGAEDQYTEPFRVSGVFDPDDQIRYNDRDWRYQITGTWSGTLRVFRSFEEEESGYKEFRREVNSNVVNITANASYNNVDQDQNSVIFYKIGFGAGNYSSGVANVRTEYDGGGGTGRCRVTGYVSPTQVNIEVLSPFTNVNYTSDWKEGDWSDVQGWPSAVGFTEGRLFWGKNEFAYGSVSDVADSYDIDVDDGGDASAIIRTISTGAIDNINWILNLQRLCFGTAGSEITARSSSFDEPLTPSAFTVREVSTQGSSPNVPAVKIDNRGQFVQKSNSRLYQLAYTPEVNDYASSDLTLLNDEILRPGVVAIGVQRQPDTRTHCVLADGKAAILLTDFIENVNAWVSIETDGIIEDVFVVPGQVEDRVHYVVKRSINGSDVRFVERWALESEALNGAINKTSDACVTYTGAATTTITGLGHLEGEAVTVWANGGAEHDQENLATVSGGSITLGAAATNVTVGLPYRSRFKSVKLAYGAQLGTALLQMKRVVSCGFVLANAHIRSLRFGPDFDNLDPLPSIEEDQEQDPDTVYGTYDAQMHLWGGGFRTDSRICLEVASPYSCRILGIVAGISTHEQT